MTLSTVKGNDMNAGHTPGPWFASDDESPCCEYNMDSGLAIIDTGREYDFTIAQHVEWNNANLIAAAPDLLEALEDMVGCVKNGSDPRDGEGSFGSGSSPQSRAIAAIAKAKGEKT